MSIPPALGPQEAPVSTTFPVAHPHCGEAVDATDAGFSATTVTIPACSHQREAGIVSSTVRKTEGYAMYRSPGPAVQHRDGLVAFG